MAVAGRTQASLSGIWLGLGIALGLGYPNPNPNPNPNPQAAELPECSPSFLLITPAEEPEAQPFYEWPKRCATLAVR